MLWIHLENNKLPFKVALASSYHLFSVLLLAAQFLETVVLSPLPLIQSLLKPLQSAFHYSTPQLLRSSERPFSKLSSKFAVFILLTLLSHLTRLMTLPWIRSFLGFGVTVLTIACLAVCAPHLLFWYLPICPAVNMGVPRAQDLERYSCLSTLIPSAVSSTIMASNSLCLRLPIYCLQPGPLSCLLGWWSPAANCPISSCMSNRQINPNYQFWGNPGPKNNPGESSQPNPDCVATTNDCVFNKLREVKGKSEGGSFWWKEM